MMKSVVAAAAFLTLGIGSAFAGQAQSSADRGTWFYMRPDQYAHPPHYAHAYHFADANANHGIFAYGTESSRGTWLFPADPNGGGANS